MEPSSDDSPLVSFENKWVATQPELEVGLKFLRGDARRVQSAFACLVHELEYAAYGIREVQPAAMKLQWWAEEFAGVGSAQARHPLTQALMDCEGFASIDLALWQSVILAAMAQRDAEPGSDTTALLAVHADFYRPLATIEQRLFGPIDESARTRAHTLSRALRETASMNEALNDGRLPLPLDLMARHRLSRGDLSRNSPEQVAALTEWLQTLSAGFADVRSAPLGVLGTASASADQWRSRAASRSRDPLKTLHDSFARLPLRSTWAAWRAAKRSPR